MKIAFPVSLIVPSLVLTPTAVLPAVDRDVNTGNFTDLSANPQMAERSG